MRIPGYQRLVVIVELVRSAVLVGVIIVGILTLLVVFLVHLFGALLCTTVSLDLVNLIHAVGLSEFVDLSADKARKEFFGKPMLDDLT